MKKSLLIFLPLAALFVFSSCAHKVTRVDPSEQIDLSGRWNNTDSRLVAEDMIKQVLGGNWITDYMAAKAGQRPTVIVGIVTNKSHEHIEAETFMKDLEASFVNTGKVRLVQGGKKREELRTEKADQQSNASASTMKKFGLEQGADFILQGSINSIVDSQKREKVVYYQVNLELTNIETNEVVALPEKKIAKYIKN